MTDILTVLRDARDLLDDEARWCKEAAAMDAEGNWCDVYSPVAVKYCAAAAVRLASGQRSTSHFRLGDPVLEYLRKMIGQQIAKINDDPDTTHADVLQVLDEAIERAQGEA